MLFAVAEWLEVAGRTSADSFWQEVQIDFAFFTNTSTETIVSESFLESLFPLLTTVNV